MSEPKRPWMKLDNAAKIYPAAMSRGWMALFRLSANLNEPVDPAVLQVAVDHTLGRFPSFAHRLRRGLFWYYFEPIDYRLAIQKDVGNPCVHMDLKGNRGYMLRVRYHENRIAVEYFHALTDGTGGLSFLKSLVAEYLVLKHGVTIDYGDGVLDCRQTPDPSEGEDGFEKFARDMTRSRRERASYLIPGTEHRHRMHITTGILDMHQMLALSKTYRATLTELMTAVLVLSIDEIQSRYKPSRKRHKPIKICVPINLRKYYATKTVRNFASYINPGIEPKFGHYTLEEAVRHIHGIMASELDEKLLNAKFSTNVHTERNPFLRLAPLLIKKPLMKLSFILKGDRQTSSTLSNLGNIQLPDALTQYVERLDFMIGPLKRNRVACGCLSYNGQLIINFTRKIEEPTVERGFFRRLVSLGQHVVIESNRRWS